MRKKQHLMQRQLAAMAGTNQSYLWEIESGRVNVGIDTLCHLSEALDLRLDEVFSRVYVECDRATNQ